MEKRLKHGDQARIAEITGFTHDYVKKVMQGIRYNEQILAVATQLVEDRARLIEQNKQRAEA